jgi:hypothetical protein
MNLYCRFVLFLTASLIITSIVESLQCLSSFKQKSLGRRSNTAIYSDVLNSRELTKIFGRISAKTILLDVPGAGTPEVANCCHGGCDNCKVSHVFDQLSAARGKWVPTYSTRTLIDGRSEKAPWAKMFDSIADPTEEISLDKEEFTLLLQNLPCIATMGPGTSVPADETPLPEAVEAFWDILITGLKKEDVNSEGEDSYRLTAIQMSEALTKLTAQPHGAMWMDFRKPFNGGN